MRRPASASPQRADRLARAGVNCQHCGKARVSYHSAVIQEGLSNCARADDMYRAWFPGRKIQVGEVLAKPSKRRCGFRRRRTASEKSASQCKWRQTFRVSATHSRPSARSLLRASAVIQRSQKHGNCILGRCPNHRRKVREPSQVRGEIESMLNEQAAAPLGGLVGVKLINVLEMNVALADRYAPAPAAAK